MFIPLFNISSVNYDKNNNCNKKYSTSNLESINNHNDETSTTIITNIKYITFIPKKILEVSKIAAIIAISISLKKLTSMIPNFVLKRLKVIKTIIKMMIM